LNFLIHLPFFFTGDRIFRVGQINTQGMNSQQVAALLRQTDPEIELVVGRPINMNEELEETPCRIFI
jgi:hypothetical protein